MGRSRAAKFGLSANRVQFAGYNRQSTNLVHKSVSQYVLTWCRNPRVVDEY
jgi:hypothetical protein